MSALLRESSMDRNSDRSANALKEAIDGIQTALPTKHFWLNLFSSFRILRNLYANPDTESSGLRLLAWSNLFNSLHQKPAEDSPLMSSSSTTSQSKIFSVHSLEEYAGEVLQCLVDEALEILNQGGCDSIQISGVEGAFEEISRDFSCILNIQRAGHEGIEQQSEAMKLEAENLAVAMGQLGL